MNQAFGRANRPRRPSINLASLIDVMFLLLIFFMVSSVFRNSAGIDITLPSAATSAEQQEAPYEIFIQDSGAITFRDTPGINLETLESEMKALLAKEPDARLALSADENSDYKSFIAVIDLARRVGGEKLIIRTQLEGGEGGKETKGTAAGPVRNP
ncbi:MAG: biopolymer transporter ExbD [Candidatus Hydrogenedentes bacterium]|nr:biopolymer transporter ExbD [Candidatus Hydrogenedentota bacterium]